MSCDIAPISPVRRGVEVVALAFVYFVAASISVVSSRFEGGTAFLWTASAIALGVLIVSDRRFWVERIAACAFASFLATSLFSLGTLPGIALAFVNMAEVLCAALLLYRLRPDFNGMTSLSEAVLLIAIAGVVCPALWSFGGAAVITAYTPIGFWHNWFAWYSGHALGTIILCPLVILLLRGDLRIWACKASYYKLAEMSAILAALALVTFLIFSRTDYPLLFIPFPIMTIAVFRHGWIGASLSVLVFAIITVVMTIQGWGPIYSLDTSDALRALFVQLYLATAVLTVLPMAGDLVERRTRYIELQQQAALSSLILDSSSDVIVNLDREGVIRFVSPSAHEVFGLKPHSLLGTMPHVIIHPKDIDRVVEVHHDAFAMPTRSFTVDYRIYIDGRQIGWFEAHVRATLDNNNRPSGLVCMLRNVSDRKQTEDRLTSVAMTDPLTGIANRRAFESALSDRLSSERRTGGAVLAMFDLDHFKHVNDTYGHATGDKILRSFSNILKAELRATDIPARIGGDEFVAIIDGDLDAGRQVFERIRTRLETGTIHNDQGCSIAITASTGIIALPPKGSRLEIMEAVDRALYKAKKGGRNRAVCYDGSREMDIEN